MNPNGRIPTINDDGFVLWESNAVVRYLCRRYGNGSLLPGTDQEYAIADQWMEWHKSTAYPDYIDLFWAIVRTEPALRDAERVAALALSVGAALQRLDAHLANKTHIVGDRLTMADIPYGPLAHRYFQLDVARPDLPNLKMWYERLCKRPAYKTHVMFAYGNTPAEWYMRERGLPVEGKD